MTPDGSSFRLISAEAADTIDVLSAVLTRATDLTLGLRRDGTIQAAIINPRTKIVASLDHWIGHHINTVLTTESQAKLDAARAQADQMTETGVLDIAAMELNHVDSAGWTLAVRYSIVKVSGDDTLLLLGHDLSSLAEAQQALVRSQQALEVENREQRERNALFSVLKEKTSDAVIFVSGTSGRVSDASSAALRMLGASRDAISNKPLAKLLNPGASGASVDDMLKSPELEHQSFEFILPGGRAVQMTCKKVRTAKDLSVMCTLSSEETPGDAGHHWDEIVRLSPDAHAIVDDNGQIETVNPAFLALTERSSVEDLEGKSIAECLGRGPVDWSVMQEMSSGGGSLRQYQTFVVGQFDGKVPVSISVTPISSFGHQKFALGLRELQSDGDQAQAGIRDSESIAELVGKASLKDIVAQTTDVIEKICIETAIEMTKNNRFAAAEMLNLSRQSLYVKLRKYGLIERSTDD